MKKSICILLMCLINMTLWAGEKSEKRIYMIDLSGSMAGYHSDINVFKKEITQLSNALSSLDSEIETIIIPFAEKPAETLRGNGNELSEKVKDFKVLKGKSDIYTAWYTGIKEIDTSKRNLLFLITDGHQNCGVDTRKLSQELKSFSKITSKAEIEAYYLILHPKYQNNKISRIFETERNMFIIYNLKDIVKKKPITKQKINTIKRNNTTKNIEKKTNTLLYYFYLPIIIIVTLLFILALILIVILRINPKEFKEIKERLQNRNVIPDNKNGINKEKRTFREIAQTPILASLAKSYKKIAKNIGVPKDKTEKILKDFRKSRFICSKPKDRHANFAPMAITIGRFPTKEELQKILKEKKLEPSSENIRAIHYEFARKAFADKYNITPNQAGQIIGALDHTIHEAEDGTIQIVPNSIHDYYKHDGLASIRKKELTGK